MGLSVSTLLAFCVFLLKLFMDKLGFVDLINLIIKMLLLKKKILNKIFQNYLKPGIEVMAPL